MDRSSGPLSVSASESVFLTIDADLLVDDDLPLPGATIVVTSARLIIATRGDVYAAGAPLWTVPFERVTLHARMPPDLSSPRPTLYMQLDNPNNGGRPDVTEGDADEPPVDTQQSWAALSTCLELRVRPVIDHLEDASSPAAAETRYAAALGELFTAFDRAYDATGGGDDDDGEDGEHHVVLGDDDALPDGFGWITADTAASLPAAGAFALAGPHPAIG